MKPGELADFKAEYDFAKEMAEEYAKYISDHNKHTTKGDKE